MMSRTTGSNRLARKAGVLFAAQLLALAALGTPAFSLPAAEAAARIQRHEFELANGLRVVLVHRPGGPFVASGWATKSGSADDPEDLRGLSHLVEHLLHQGTETLGTSDRSTERRLLEQQERLVDRLQAAQAGNDAEKVRAVARSLSELNTRLEVVRRKGESAAFAANAGLFGIDALTERDFVLFYAMVPRDRLEVWAWLESDRLLEPVFRDFYGELPVVAEELAQRVTSLPGSRAMVDLEATFWPLLPGAAGYAWPPGGVAEDLRRARPAAAKAHFERYWSPDRLVLALVGDFEVSPTRELVERYFSRLERRRAAPVRAAPVDVPVVVPEPPGSGPVELDRACACSPRVALRWPSVQAGDALEPAYDMLVGVLNGRRGRLHQNLVEQERRAFAAYAVHEARARGGAVTLTAEALEEAGNAPPAPASTGVKAAVEGDSLDTLASLLVDELRRLAEGGITAPELQRVRRRLMTEHARALESNRGMLLQLLAREAVDAQARVWSRDEQLRQVNAQQVQQLAQRLVAQTPSRLRVRRAP